MAVNPSPVQTYGKKAGGSSVLPLVTDLNGVLYVFLTADYGGSHIDLQCNSSGSLKVEVASSLPAGSATIGSVKITDAGGTNVVGITTSGVVRSLKTDVFSIGGTEMYAGSEDGLGIVDWSGVFVYGVENPAGTAKARVLRLDSSGNLMVLLGSTLATELGRVGITDGTGLAGVDNDRSHILGDGLLCIVASDGVDADYLRVDGSGNLKVVQQGTVTVGGTVSVSSFGSSIKIDSAQNVVTISDPVSTAQKLAVGSGGEISVKNLANSGVDIGDVTINNAGGGSAVNIQDGGNVITVDGTVAVSGVTPNTGATNLGKAESAAHSSGDVGVLGLAVLLDTKANAGAAYAGSQDVLPSPLATDGQYASSIADNAGATRVSTSPLWQKGTGFNATGVLTTVACPSSPKSRFSLQVVKTAGASTSWVVVLEGSNDGTNFTTILTHSTSSCSDGETVFSGAERYPCLYFRANIKAITSTTVTVLIVGME
jgi:hypothetical protein